MHKPGAGTLCWDLCVPVRLETGYTWGTTQRSAEPWTPYFRALLLEKQNCTARVLLIAWYGHMWKLRNSCYTFGNWCLFSTALLYLLLSKYCYLPAELCTDNSEHLHFSSLGIMTMSLFPGGCFTAAKWQERDPHWARDELQTPPAWDCSLQPNTLPKPFGLLHSPHASTTQFSTAFHSIYPVLPPYGFLQHFTLSSKAWILAKEMLSSGCQSPFTYPTTCSPSGTEACCIKLLLIGSFAFRILTVVSLHLTACL